MLDSHAGFVKFDIFLEPLHHFGLTGQNQGISIATMSEPEVTNFFEECRREFLLQIRDFVLHERRR